MVRPVSKNACPANKGRSICRTADAPPKGVSCKRDRPD